jgi:phosphopantothenoylcysteine decarboxylase/phosphopantothenate--cysteine ligase
VCGGIAAYKAVELTRLLVKSGARVQVVMTEAATKFVAPLSFETITARRVFVEMFPAQGDLSPWHTEIATWADVALVAPATANHLARLAAGLADDLLSTLLLTLERPRILCPAMNPRMWANPATQDNLTTLKKRGYRIVNPEEGHMARPGEDDGLGRLADPETIFREVSHVLSAPQDMRGVRVLVTAGRTEEFWDPVRMLTNRATGRMGFALAEEARERGADVVLIHGPTDVIPPSGVRVRRITTANELAQAVKQEFPQSNIVLMAAAVADYTFTQTAPQKIKKGEPNPEVHLVPTEDILKSLAARKDNKIIVGFALETENVLENALKKLREKHMDMVVANNPMIEGAGFAGETNQVLLIHRNGQVNELPLQSKREIAREILNAVIETYRHPEPEPEEIERQVAEEQAAQFPDYTLAGEDIEEETRRAPAPTNGRPQEHHKPKHPHRHEKHKAPKPPHEPPAAQAPKPVQLPAPKVEAPTPPPPAIIHPSDLPSTDAAATQPPGPKRSRSRRGGRRAKARLAKIAARQAAMVEGSNAPQGAPLSTGMGSTHPVPNHEPAQAPKPIPQMEMAIPAPVTVVASDEPAKQKPRRAGSGRSKVAALLRPRAKKAKESAPE